MNEKELKELIDQGLSIAGLAEHFGKSKGSVRHWLNKFNLKTNHKQFARKEPGEKLVGKVCSMCKVYKDGYSFYRKRKNTELSPYCKPCTNAHTLGRQQSFKQKCVDYSGGKCEHCGYNHYLGALEFHHKDPTKKDFSIAKARLTKFDDRIKDELDKCILLCANCHREEHARLKGLLP